MAKTFYKTIFGPLVWIFARFIQKCYSTIQESFRVTASLESLEKSGICRKVSELCELGKIAQLEVKIIGPNACLYNHKLVCLNRELCVSVLIFMMMAVTR